MSPKTSLASFAFLVSLTLVVATDASAQFGLSVVTRQMEQNGLFVPHGPNLCDSGTEEFVAVGSDGTNSSSPAGQVGYCIEKNQRSAANWEDARQTCAGLRKRLPEPDEWKIACELSQATTISLNNITGDWEWASNFPLAHYSVGTTNFLGAVAMGETNCIHKTEGAIAAGSAAEESSYAYRCVR